MTKLQKLCRGLFWSAAILIGTQTAAVHAGMGVSPLKQEITVKGGEEGKFTVNLVNNARGAQDATVSAHVTISDVLVLEAGALVFKDPGTVAHSASKWITLTNKAATVEPGHSTALEFTIAPPAFTPPGEYYAAIIVTLDKKGRDSKGMELEYRIASGVFVTIPGKTMTRQAKITRCEVLWPQIAAAGADQPDDTQPPRISLTVHNTGEARFTATGKVAMFDANNRLVFAGPLVSKRACVFGGDSRVFETPIAKILPVGKYTAKIGLDYQSTWASLRETLTLDVTPEQSGLMALLKTRLPNAAIGIDPTPDKLALSMPPGASRSIAFSVKNTSDYSVQTNVGIFPSDGESADSWISLATADCTVVKGAKKTIGLTVRVPKGTKAGKYISTITLEGGPEGADPSTLLVPVEVDVQAEK